MPQHKISPLASAGRSYSHDYSSFDPARLRRQHTRTSQNAPQVFSASSIHLWRQLPSPAAAAAISVRLGEQMKAVEMS